MTELQLGLLMLLLVPVIWGMLWWGWRRRGRRQADVGALHPVPDPLSASAFGPVETIYVSTTRAGDWLDRVVVHGLGTRSAAEVSVHPDGVLVQRTSAPDVWVPAADLTGVRRESGAAGKFVREGGLVVLTWTLGDAGLDTALRTRYEHDRDALERAVQDLCDQSDLRDQSEQGDEEDVRG